MNLLKRSLTLILPVVGVYLLIMLILGQPILPALAGLGFATAVLALIQLRPDARRACLWILVLAAEALLWLGAWHWPAPGPAPALYVAAVLGVLGLMLDGPVLGSVLLVLGLIQDAFAFGRIPVGASDERIGVAALGLLGVGLFWSAMGWYWALHHGMQELGQASDSLRRQRDERQVLTLALFHELKAAHRGLLNTLGFEGSAPWDDALTEARRVQQRADQIRALRSSFSEEPHLQTQAADFTRGVMRAILWSSLALSAAGTAMGLAFGQGPGDSGPFALLVLSALLFAIRGRREVPRWMAISVFLLGPLILGAGVLTHWGEPLHPTMSFWSLSILNAGLLLGLRWALGTVVAAAIALLSASVGQALLGRFTGHSAAVLLLSWSLVSIVCLQAMVWQRAVLVLLEDGRRQLANSLVLRRRLLGTLFHDVANPLMAIIRLAEEGRAGLEAPGDAERARRLCRRLGELLEDNQAWLTSEDDAESAKLGLVELAPLLAGLAELFVDKLAAKRLSLHIDAPPGLRAVAQPAMLRDSVLGNLLSNAHKFSRPGSSLELTARAEDGAVCIRLADRGPGWPEGLRERLAAGADQPSTPGTEGERGQGLGLALAREHVLRMGGSFELLDRDGGGGVALVRLKAAP